MTLHFSSKKSLKYKIYDIIDGKKKFAKKGRFTGEKSVEYTPKGTQFIVQFFFTKILLNPVLLIRIGYEAILEQRIKGQHEASLDLMDRYAKAILVTYANQQTVDFLYDDLHDEIVCPNASYVQAQTPFFAAVAAEGIGLLVAGVIVIVLFVLGFS